MEIIYYLSGFSLLFFMILATYDGFYLHIWKYALFNRSESIFEHKTHTIRAVLFPLIVWCLFLSTDHLSLWFGIGLVVLDVVVLAIDAYAEDDSRQFMGGLPKWEYIVHLFANGFHFAAVILAIGIKISSTNLEFIIAQNSVASAGGKFMLFIAEQSIPGAILLAILHLVVLVPGGKTFWNKHRTKVTCC